MRERKVFLPWLPALVALFVLAPHAPAESATYQFCEEVQVGRGVVAGDLIALSAVELKAQAGRNPGDDLVTGDVVLAGSAENRSGQPLSLVQKGGTEVTLAASDVAVVRKDCAAGTPTSCSVTCDAPHFACCRSAGPSCFCSTADVAVCDSGGHGASSCSITVTPPTGTNP